MSLKFLVAAAALVTGLPNVVNTNSKGNYIRTLAAAAARCDKHQQQISCCKKGKSAGTLVDGILGGNCSPIDLDIIAVTVPISTACINEVACCTGDQTGLFDLACTNLHL